MCTLKCYVILFCEVLACIHLFIMYSFICHCSQFLPFWLCFSYKYNVYAFLKLDTVVF